MRPMRLSAFLSGGRERLPIPARPPQPNYRHYRYRRVAVKSNSLAQVEWTTTPLNPPDTSVLLDDEFPCSFKMPGPVITQ